MTKREEKEIARTCKSNWIESTQWFTITRIFKVLQLIYSVKPNKLMQVSKVHSVVRKVLASILCQTLMTLHKIVLCLGFHLKMIPWLMMDQWTKRDKSSRIMIWISLKGFLRNLWRIILWLQHLNRTCGNRMGSRITMMVMLDNRTSIVTTLPSRNLIPMLLMLKDRRCWIFNHKNKTLSLQVLVLVVMGLRTKDQEGKSRRVRYWGMLINYRTTSLVICMELCRIWLGRSKG